MKHHRNNTRANVCGHRTSRAAASNAEMMKRCRGMVAPFGESGVELPSNTV